MSSDLQAYSSAFLAHRHRILAFLLSLVRSRSEAEDLLQDVYLALAEAVEAGRRIDDTLAWSLATAKYLTFARWRAQGREARAVDQRIAAELLSVFDQRDEEDADDARHGWLERLPHCLQRLSARARAAIERCYRDGQSGHEAAAALGVSRSNLYVILHRSRAQLVECLEDQR